jgi:serine/threonine protein kinase
MEDRYEIREKIGQGGIGRVHRGYDHKMQREVAIKRILTSMDDPSLEGAATKQLMVEVEALAKLQHPHIITVFDVGHDEEGPYVVMELLNGKSLDEIIEDGPMSWQDFKEVAVQSQEALLAAQELGMIHSDLKPPNIMLSYLPSGNFQVKIVDFGLAVLVHKQSKEEIKAMDSVFGSIFFMPPEQFERQPLDARSDLYSIGCVYYQALTGTYPFNGETGNEVMDAHLYHKVIPIQELRRDIPAWACEWVMWLINHNRDDRPQSAREALSNFLLNETNSKPVAAQVSDRTESPDTAAALQSTGAGGQQPPGLLPSMTDTTSHASQAPGSLPRGFPTFGLSMVNIRRIGIAAAALTLIAIVSIMVVKRNERVRRGWIYDNIVALAGDKKVTEIPMNADELQILLDRIAASPANAVITAQLKALTLAKSTDGTNIDTVVAKFATTAGMPDDIRQKILKDVIETRHSAAAIPIIKAYAAKTGKGKDTLVRLEQINGVRPAPDQTPEKVTAKVTANPAPAPKPAPKPTPPPSTKMPAPNASATSEMKAIMAILKGNDEARKADAITALARSADNSTQLTFLNLLDDQSLSALRPQIIAAFIAYNSHPSRVKNENYSRQAWKQMLWRLKNYEEKEPALLALKDMENQWVTDLLQEYANLKTAPKLSSLASGILANRKK